MLTSVNFTVELLCQMKCTELKIDQFAENNWTVFIVCSLLMFKYAQHRWVYTLLNNTEMCGKQDLRPSNNIFLNSQDNPTTEILIFSFLNHELYISSHVMLKDSYRDLLLLIQQIIFKITFVPFTILRNVIGT